MSCICEKVDRFRQLTLATGSWIEIQMTKDNGYYIEALADGYASVKINYCPICGRKLVKDNE